MITLRSQVIRLAHQNLELRPFLLSALKESSSITEALTLKARYMGKLDQISDDAKALSSFQENIERFLRRGDIAGVRSQISTLVDFLKGMEAEAESAGGLIEDYKAVVQRT